MFKYLVIVFVTVLEIQEILGHGMMLEPPNRASLWRFDPDLEPVFEDNEFFCGGVPAQFGENGGKCGECGDNYADPRPRSNENTGKYGQGTVTRSYEAGSVVNTSVTLTANHLGWFSFSLCVLDDPNLPEPEGCFTELQFENGASKYNVVIEDYIVESRVRLPEGVTCERCVLRWHYVSGNSWGICPDGNGAVGCGDQETFRSCSDVRIV